MTTLRYTRDHEWLREEADGTFTIGITHYAQEQLGDIVYVELPALASHVDSAGNAVVIESVKAVGEVKLPVGATIVAVNTALSDQPDLVNTAPEGAGWLLRVKLDTAQGLHNLMDAQAYTDYVGML